ncbi:hypothetical protein CP980_19145 [Streptomyces vinaceus]|uniref:Uncharacterized protein n=1 Tax=Streptomyces vinaceus TaxID=1960 RepID=A0A5J6JBA1_STRVI|nr:hypothetical protein [Streptomyces vinaceus]QEV46931.1 hypothetical protein CP980_19145 [Streptomyces vinaceus]GHE58564.1 hypothetical protein GCM10017778_48660 [Streptomyces vinaceus]
MNQDRRRQAEDFLQPDEQLIAVCACEPGPGVPSPPEDLLAPQEPAALGRRIEEKLPRPLQQFFKARAHDPRREAAEPVPDPADGKGMEGGWQSAAGRFLVDRANAHGAQTDLLVVTDRRWFALTDVSPLWQSTPVMKQYWEVPRSAVTVVRAAPGLQGRMDIEFADFSWVAVTAATPAEAPSFAASAARYR